MRPYELGDYFGDYVVADFETTNNQFGNPAYDNRLVCAVWYVSWEDKYYCANKNYNKLLEHLWSARVLVAHNAKFELKWLRKLGAFLDGIQVFDPMLAQYTLDGIERNPVNLDAMCKRHGFKTKDKIIDSLMDSGVCPSEQPYSRLVARCKRDVVTTAQLYEKLSKELLEQGLMPMYHTKAEFCKVLADMELRGMQLDSERVVDSYIERIAEFEKVQQELDEFTGGINHNSPKQKQEYLYDTLGFAEVKDHRGKPKRTSAGGRATDADTLLQLVPKTKEQEEYLELIKRFGKLNAEITKALQKFKDCVDEGELLYADFNQHITVSHRLSSSGTKHKVQFQNMQREFKKMFKARKKGWLMGEADGSQIEFRVAAYLGQDQQAMQDIRDKVDVHSFTADTLTEAGQDTDRQGAKSHTFKPLYGGESGTDAEQAYYRAFKLKYCDIAATQEQWKEQVINTGSFSLPTGLVLRFPNKRVNKYGYLNVQNKVVNYPVQYLATGEIIPIVACCLENRMRINKMESFLVNTVHDSVVAEIHPDEVELFHDLAVKAFTDDVYEYLYQNYDIEFNVPLGVGIKIGEFWSEGEETKVDVEPPWLFAA